MTEMLFWGDYPFKQEEEIVSNKRQNGQAPPGNLLQQNNFIMTSNRFYLEKRRCFKKTNMNLADQLRFRE